MYDLFDQNSYTDPWIDMNYDPGRGGDETDVFETRIDGGADQTLDLTTAGDHIESIEVIDITGSGDNSLILDAQAVRDVSDHVENDLTSLTVLGYGGDQILLEDDGGSETDALVLEDIAYRVFEKGAVQIGVETDEHFGEDGVYYPDIWISDMQELQQDFEMAAMVVDSPSA